jgi:phosphate-selective porin OprO and OprP
VRSKSIAKLLAGALLTWQLPWCAAQISPGPFPTPVAPPYSTAPTMPPVSAYAVPAAATAPLPAQSYATAPGYTRQSAYGATVAGGVNAAQAPAIGQLPTLPPNSPVRATNFIQPSPAPTPPEAAAAAPPEDEIDELRERLEQAETDLIKMRADSTSAADKLMELFSKPKSEPPKYPLVRLSGFMQVDDGLFSQSPQSEATLGNIQDGIGFRRARLQAIGSLTEFTRYSIEFDFAIAGRPSFVDVWGEQANLPFFGTIRIGQFRQPTTMDALTSIRHLDFLERNAVFQALDPFRRVGIMAYRVSDDEMTTLAYSAYATGFTFWNGASNVYGTMGDTRNGTQITDHGGIAAAIRATHLLYYDEPAEGRYLLHVGAGYLFSELGGRGTTGLDARTFEARSIPEFFVGDPTAAGLTAAGTPFVVDTGRVLATDFHMGHLELAGKYGSAHFQTEVLGTALNQLNGPTVAYYGAYAQTGIFLTGESAGYNKQTGVLDYNVKPNSEFVGTGTHGRMCGWGAWELAARWTYLNLAATNYTPGNVLPGPAGPPANPDPGALNESTVALNWWWNQYTRVQFNWIHTMLENNANGFSAMDIFATRFQIEF